MDNQNRMSTQSNLMLVDIIHGSSSKYTQDDVLEAELELSRRNLTESEIDVLKSKVSYIGGINVGRSAPERSTTSSSSSSASYSDNSAAAETSELKGSDATLVNVLIGYIAIISLGSLAGLFIGNIVITVISLGVLGINVYGIYGLLNKLRMPVLMLIGVFTYSLTKSITSVLSLIVSVNLAYLLIPIIFMAIGGAILYFLTKESMRKAYNLDGESIRNAMIIGVAAALLLQFF